MPLSLPPDSTLGAFLPHRFWCVHEFDNVMSIWLSSMSGDEERRAAVAKTSTKLFVFKWRFQSGDSIDERLKQENQPGKRQRKMKWKLISFKNKIQKIFCSDFQSPDWSWLWGILGISRFIESLRTKGVGGEAEENEEEENSTGRQSPLLLFWALFCVPCFTFCHLTDGSEWLIDSFRLEIAWWIEGCVLSPLSCAFANNERQRFAKFSLHFLAVTVKLFLAFDSRDVLTKYVEWVSWDY